MILLQRGGSDKMQIVVIIINLVLTYIFVGGFLPTYGTIVGIIYIVISICGICYYRKKKSIPLKFINRFLVSTGDGVYDIQKNEIMVSAAFLALGMKIGTVFALLVSVGMVIVIALCILIATGFFIEGRKSGMTISGALGIAKVVVWIYEKINGLYEFIARQIVKIEFKILKIDVRENR